jgi:signal transduction histidine kinase
MLQFLGFLKWTNPRALTFLSAFLAAGIFALDVALPARVAIGVLYVAVVVICMWIPVRRCTLVVAAACSCLIILGMFWSPTGREGWAAIANRTLAILAVWVVAVLISRRKWDLREQEQRAHQQMAVLVELAQSKKLSQGDMNAALREIAEAAARTMRANRVGIWRFNEDGSRLRCVEQYHLNTGEHSRGAELEAEKYPAYFAAVEKERVIAAHDARTDPRTREFRETYLEPLGITAMLDSAIRSQGRMVGVVCHERMGPSPPWSIAEQTFAGSVADFVDLAIEASERNRAERLERGRSRVLEQLAQGAPLEKVLTTLVAAIEEIQPDLIASVLLLDRAEGRLRLGAAPGLPDFYNRAVDGLKIGPDAGSCGTCAYTGKRVIVDDVMSHPYWANYHELARQAGFRACWSEPIRSSHSEILGTFAMYYRQPRGPGASDLDMIQRAADLAGIAIEQRLAERELQLGREMLESRVEERTSQLVEAKNKLEYEITEHKRAEAALRESEMRLAQQARELARSNADLERFAYIASHDLQEPLRAIAGYCKLLQNRYQGKLDPSADEFLTHAVDGATRMKALIDGLLSYSRVRTRGSHLESTDCNAVLDEALSNLRLSIEDSSAKVTRNGMPSVLADKTQLVELFQNLIGNAIKYHNQRAPEVHVEAHVNNGEWIFSVRDNGIGIKPNDLENIFDMFQRLHPRDVYPGTGIGLAICKRIVERLGGRIWAESQPGMGSTFYFTIPKA